MIGPFPARGVLLSTRYLPQDRRDLQRWMVGMSLGHLLQVGVVLKLYRNEAYDRYHLQKLIDRLFRLVCNRHTHLWDLNPTQWPTVNPLAGATAPLKGPDDPQETAAPRA